jgi:hypothetical protein
MVPLVRECGKIFTVGQATDDNMAHVHTHTERGDVTLCVFACQQYLQDSASLLCFTFIFCLVSKA